MRWLVASALLVMGCGTSSPDAASVHASLGGKVVARVGDFDIEVPAVAAVASAERIPPTLAASRLVDDVVASRAATARGFDRDSDVRYAVEAAMARAALDRIKAAAYASPPTDDEVRAFSAMHWLEVDAPPSMVVVHAVVTRPKNPDAGTSAAKSVAAAISAAVASATSADEFTARAQAVPHPGVGVVVQPLPPFAADNRVLAQGSGTLDPLFVAGAEALAPGATSGVIESSFGWHVIRMIERRPKIFVPFEERRAIFAEEAHAKRAEEALAKLEAAVRAREPVVMANGVDDILTGALPAIGGGASSTATSQ